MKDMNKNWVNRNTVAIILFSISNFLVSIAALYAGRNVLLAKYAASPYDVFIEEVLDTEIGRLLVGIASTIILLCILVFGMAVFGYIRYRKNLYDRELIMFHTIICLLTAFTTTKLVSLAFMAAQIEIHPTFFVSTVYYCITAIGILLPLAKAIYFCNAEVQGREE